MTTQTEALKLALEALKLGDTVFYPQTSIAIAAIEGVLAQQSNEQVEPVARIDYWPSAESDRYIANIVAWEHLPVGTLLYTHPPVPTAQPKEPLVINSQEKASEFIEKTLWEVIDVAAMFPKAKPNPRTWEHLMVYSPQPKPLTDEQIGDIAALFYPRWQGHEGFARAIEAAHGIKE